MKLGTIGIAAVLSVAATTAHADEAALAKAVTNYNNLPSRARVLAVEPLNTVPGTGATRLPGWLAKANLNDKEAAATVAAFGVYGNDFRANYRSREWSKEAVTAGWVADTLSTSLNARHGSGLPDAESNLAPSRALTEVRRASLLSAMMDMGTCSGALVRAAQKAARLRTGDDATRLLVKAQRDLGAAALPPDDSCLS
jgi:hypothetical protein